LVMSANALEADRLKRAAKNIFFSRSFKHVGF